MTWKTLKSKKEADFPLFSVFDDLVELPNGLQLNYYWVEKIPVVVVLPIISDKIVMVKQYRYPIKSYSLELPAGHVKSSETTEECALRELKEETGYTANSINKILSYNPSTEFSDQIYHVFIANDLKPGETDREKYELMDVEILKPESVIEKILGGSITDGRTITFIVDKFSQWKLFSSSHKSSIKQEQTKQYFPCSQDSFLAISTIVYHLVCSR